MKTALVAAFTLALAACASTTPRIDPARLGEVHKGKTTVAEIVRQFGTPSLLSKNPDGTQSATYVHGDRQSGGTSIVPLVAIVPRDSVTFYFDARGVLSDVKTTQANASVAAQAKAGTPAPGGGANLTAPGTSLSAPANSAPQGETRSWWMPGWLPPSTTPNR